MTDDLPTFSIVVPTYNRPDQLGECVRHLARLEYPRELYEVVVVDDGGKVDLESRVHANAADLRIRLLRQENTGPAGARNTGAAASVEQYLLFTDDDCAPSPDYLTLIAKRIARHPGAAIGGRSVVVPDAGACSVASQVLVDYLYDYFNADHENAQFFTSNNLCVSRRQFDELEGFDTRYPLAAAEDRDLCERWLERGYRMVYAPEAIVWHYHPMDLAGFWRQHSGYGRGAAVFHWSKGQRNESSLEVEPLGFYFDLLRYPWTKSVAHRVRTSALLGVSQVANAWGFFAAQLSRPWKSIDD